MRPEFVAQYADLEQRHFWHLARRRIVLEVLRRFVQQPSGRKPRLLDVGCGAGTNLLHFKQAQFECVGIEPDATLVNQAKAASGVPVWHTGLPLREAIDGLFDVIVLLDVLEHIDDDRGALVSLRRSVRRGGIVVLNVPAHPRLWSALDEMNQHRRRYTRASLCSVLEEGGYRVRYVRFWGSLGCPLVFLQRWLLLSQRQVPYTAYVPPPALNAMLRRLLWWEFLATEHVKLPFGVSLLAVAQRL